MFTVTIITYSCLFIMYFYDVFFFFDVSNSKSNFSTSWWSTWWTNFKMYRREAAMSLNLKGNLSCASMFNVRNDMALFMVRYCFFFKEKCNSIINYLILVHTKCTAYRTSNEFMGIETQSRPLWTWKKSRSEVTRHENIISMDSIEMPLVGGRVAWLLEDFPCGVVSELEWDIRHIQWTNPL